ncbi:hypothetical protein ACF08B_37420 [Streptomyces sp. NPDC015139]|uniref:hypothetical protein n=1 Tax=Streptomyces sp. NPDC015139 TaxID=3364942 RepID=UPI0036F5A5B7
MAHRPYPNRERARRQVERHHSAAGTRTAARPRFAAAPPAPRTESDSRVGEYRLSTR